VMSSRRQDGPSKTLQRALGPNVSEVSSKIRFEPMDGYQRLQKM
jgi:hypothetical protein